jgi:hypothetical protein
MVSKNEKEGQFSPALMVAASLDKEERVMVATGHDWVGVGS